MYLKKIIVVAFMSYGCIHTMQSLQHPVPEVLGIQLLQLLAIKLQQPIPVLRPDGTVYSYTFDVHTMQKRAGESNLKQSQRKPLTYDDFNFDPKCVKAFRNKRKKNR